MYVTTNRDRAFLQQNISTAVHVRFSWLSIVYVPLAAHLTRPVVLRVPIQVLGQPWSPIMHSKLYPSRIPYIPYHTVFVHRSPPAACNSSSFLSIHQVLVSTQALLLARVCGALAICLCPHPSSNPYSLQFEEVDDNVSARSKMWKVEVVD